MKKLYIFKRILFSFLSLGLILTLAVSCQEDDTQEERKNEKENIENLTFIGKITTEEGFEKENVEVKLNNFHIDKNTDYTLFNIFLKEARFSNDMPLSLDMELRDIVTQHISQNGDMLFEKESVVPYAMFSYIEDFTCYNLAGEQKEDTLIFSFTCRGINAHYLGIRKK